MVQSIPTPLSFFRTTNSLDVSVFEKLPVISIEVKCGPGSKGARFFRHFIADNIVIAILRNISENQAKHFPLRPLRWREEDLRGERSGEKMKTVAQVASRLEKFCGGGLTRKKQDLACRVIYSEPHRQFNSRKLRHNHIRNQQIGIAVLSVPECIQGVCKRLRQETGHLQYFCQGFGDDSFIVHHEKSVELVF